MQAAKNKLENYSKNNKSSDNHTKIKILFAQKKQHWPDYLMLYYELFEYKPKRGRTDTSDDFCIV